MDMSQKGRHSSLFAATWGCTLGPWPGILISSKHCQGYYFTSCAVATSHSVARYWVLLSDLDVMIWQLEKSPAQLVTHVQRLTRL